MERRHFLHVLGGSALAACSSGGDSAPIKAASLKVGDVVALSNASAFVGRDAGGLYAMSSICKHAQCDVRSGTIERNPVMLKCPCHGSAYDAVGTVTSPPATQSLDHIALSVGADGTISVSPNQIVPASTRTMG